MSKLKSHRVGIIAEDESDVDSVKVLMHRISENHAIDVKKFVGKGCGRIKRKCRSWASTLKAKGCRCLILIHDLDRNDLVQLRQRIEDAVSPSPIQPYLICIPVEEMEAWWLSDPQAIKLALNLRKTPNVKGHPEDIASPKERISALVRHYSDKTKVYMNTEHNAKIAVYLDLGKAKRCHSFVPFFDFVTKHISST
jgi:hypothetical protein